MSEPGPGAWPGVWEMAAGANRLLFYASALLAAGLALFPLALRRDRAAPALGAAAAGAAGLSAVLALGLGGALMLNGAGGGLLNPRAWALASRTTLGLSAWLAVPGALLLLAGFASGRSVARRALYAIGATLLLVSFVVTGHAATAPPVVLMTPVVALHLLAAAFWFGALAPLYAATRSDSAVQAGRLMQQFSTFAVLAVGLLFASGLLISWGQVESMDQLLQSAYGGRLLVKLGLFALLLALAGANKLLLTPRLVAGDPAAARLLRRSIALEAVLYLGILAVAALLSMSAPPRG